MNAALAVLSLVLAVAPAAGASAQPEPPPETITLGQAMRLLRERSPRSRAEQARADVASAERVAADVLPNPSLSYGGTHLVQGESTGAVQQHQLMLEQPLLLFGQRGARREVAALGVARARAHAEASLAERAHDVRQAFFTLLARQRRVERLEEGRADLAQVSKIVEGRVAAGDKSRYDSLRVAVEARALESQLAAARADVDDGAGHLAALLGLPGWRPRAQGELRAPDLSPDLEALWKRAEASHPALIAARRDEAAARGAIGLARRERLPVPALSAGAALTREVNGTSVLFGLSTPLPLTDRGQGAIARSEAEARAARLEREAAVAEARAELERAVAVLRQRRAAEQGFEREVTERLPTLRKMSEDAYREGRGGVLELLDSFRVLAQMRLVEVDRLLDVRLAEADTLAAAGLIDGGP
jgi:cobalt-zinc-cadmium efflux system outer membrane protein